MREVEPRPYHLARDAALVVAQRSRRSARRRESEVQEGLGLRSSGSRFTGRLSDSRGRPSQTMPPQPPVGRHRRVGHYSFSGLSHQGISTLPIRTTRTVGRPVDDEIVTFGFASIGASSSAPHQEHSYLRIPQALTGPGFVNPHITDPRRPCCRGSTRGRTDSTTMGHDLRNVDPRQAQFPQSACRDAAPMSYSATTDDVRRCVAIAAAGRPCRAYAIWDDPNQRCVAHGGRHQSGWLPPEAPPLCGKGRSPSCCCASYPFPHRPGAGRCPWPEYFSGVWETTARYRSKCCGRRRGGLRGRMAVDGDFLRTGRSTGVLDRSVVAEFAQPHHRGGRRARSR